MSRTKFARLGWYPVLALSMLMALVASRYLSLNPEVYFPEQREVYEAHTLGILLHVIGAILAVLLGPFQFHPRIRARYIRLHRAMGRLYLLGILVGGLSGIYMSSLAFGGFAARSGFFVLAVSWLTSGWMAYRRIRAGDIASHREWMLRSYALTFAAVTLRLWQVVLSELLGVPFEQAYQTVAWLCWVPNLMFIEYWISKTRPSRRAQASPTGG